jgi:hypothetical protein
MMISEISMKRVVVAVTGAAGLVLLLLGAVVAVRWHGEVQRVRTAVESEFRSGDPNWQERLDEWVLTPRVARYALEGATAGNAAALLWPAGFARQPLHCPYFLPQPINAPGWERDREKWMRAASCAELDRFVEAAGMERFDVLDAAVRGDVALEELRFSVDAYRGILTGIGALLSRAHLRLERGELARAESDLRALVTLGIMLVEKSPNRMGLEYGHRAISAALSHLAVLREVEGARDEAARIAETLEGLPPHESGRGLVNGILPRVASVPAGFAPVAEVVRRAEVPLAIRLSALQGIQLGYMTQPWELLLGSSRERYERARELGEEEALYVWWQDMDEFHLPLSYRAGELFRMLL